MHAQTHMSTIYILKHSYSFHTCNYIHEFICMYVMCIYVHTCTDICPCNLPIYMT